jgi:hypothetical protein
VSTALDRDQLIWARSSVQTGDEFGDVLIPDGDRLFVRAPGSHQLEFGAVYLLDAESGAIVLKYRGRTRGSRFGASVAVRGRHLLIGAPGSRRGNGAAYLLDSPAGRELAHFRRGRDEGRLGSAVALLDRRIAVSAPYTVSSPPVTLVFAK